MWLGKDGLGSRSATELAEIAVHALQPLLDNGEVAGIVDALRDRGVLAPPLPTSDPDDW